MKRIITIIGTVTLLAGCSSDYVGIDGGSYNPDALLVHDQSSYMLWLVGVVIMITLFVIANRLKRLIKAIERLATNHHYSQSEVPGDSNGFKEWQKNNPGKTINDYYQAHKPQSSKCKICGVIVEPGEKYCQRHK